MNFKELYREVSKQNDITLGSSKEICQSVFEIISNQLGIGDTVKISGFGTFELRTREARIGLNPRTKEKLEIPEKKYPVFKAAKALKDITQEA